MKTIKVEPINRLAARLSQLHSTLPVVQWLESTFYEIDPFVPIDVSLITTVVRAGETIGYCITPLDKPAPTSANVDLHSGTLWFEAKLLGPDFASSRGHVGIPFASAKITTSGSVAFVPGLITLDAMATLSIAVTSRVLPPTRSASEAIGTDFLAAQLAPFPRGKVTFAPTGASIEVSGTADATLYGQQLSVVPIGGATASLVEFPAPFTIVDIAAPTTFAIVECTAAASTTFRASSSTSTEFRVSGSGSLVSCGVAFPIATVAADNVPDETDAWGLVVRVEAGLVARFAATTVPVRLTAAQFGLTPARLLGLVTLSSRSTQRYPLWSPPPRRQPDTGKAAPDRPDLARPAPVVSLQLPIGAAASIIATPQTEAVLLNCLLEAVVDRPVAADGERIDLRGDALAERIRTSGGTAVKCRSALEPQRPIALATPNAFLPVGTPNGFTLVAKVIDGRLSGQLEISFPTWIVIPTLPDPYASYYDPSSRGRSSFERDESVSAVVTWTPQGQPDLKILSNPPAAPDAAAEISAAETASSPPAATFAEQADGAAAATLRRIQIGEADEVVVATLLDVSSRADHWGILLKPAGVDGFAFDGLTLTAPSTETMVFTAPGISWEPVVDTTRTDTARTSAATPKPDSPNDGFWTVLLVAVDRPVSLIPGAALSQYQAAAGSAATGVLFTLPFGIIALLDDGPHRTTGIGPPEYLVPVVEFPEAMSSARVLSIRGTGPNPPGLMLPGSAIVGFDKNNPAYGAVAMGVENAQLTIDGIRVEIPAPAAIWDEQFGPKGKAGGIPVSRIDLSGFGTSLFSDWRDTAIPPRSGVVRAKFDVLLGRTAHELILFQLWICPWCIRVQRSIMFDRSDGGEVVKHDSGWRAVDVGRFALLDSSLMPGPVVELDNVRNLTFRAGPVRVGSINYVPVSFDADVVFDRRTIFVAANGRNPAQLVPATSIGGYVPLTVGSAPTANQIIDLMKQVGRVTGRTSGVARIGGTENTRFTLDLTSFGAAATAGIPAKLQTAVFGTPRLPKDGQWSVTKRPSSIVTRTPQAVDPATPVPLTRADPPPTLPTPTLPTSANTWGEGWRMLDPEDARSVENPSNFYGLLQGTGVSKTLLEHPLIADTGTALGFGQKPRLADVGALLGVSGLFPDVERVLSSDDTGDLPIGPDGFTKTYDWDITQAPRTLLNLSKIKLVLAYGALVDGNWKPAHARLVLNATSGAPNWNLKITNLSFRAVVGNSDSDPLLTLCGGFEAGSSIKPGFVGLEDATGVAGPLEVLYGEALSAIKKIFSGLGGLAKGLGGNAKLDVGFTGRQLGIRQGFTLPTIPLGFGQIRDVGVDLDLTATIPNDVAFHVGIGSKAQPFHWLVTPLAGTGAIVLGVAHDEIDVFVQAGLGLGAGIDVVVAKGSASLVVGMNVAVADGNVTLGLPLAGNADVDVLNGLASASLTLGAALGLDLQPSQANLSGAAAVGIHIGICWLIKVDFDGSWSFTTSMAL